MMMIKAGSLLAALQRPEAAAAVSRFLLSDHTGRAAGSVGLCVLRCGPGTMRTERSHIYPSGSP